MRHFEVKVSYQNRDCWPAKMGWTWGDGTRAGRPCIRNMNPEVSAYATFLAGNYFSWGEYEYKESHIYNKQEEFSNYHVFTFLNIRAARSFQLRYGLDAE